MVVRLTNASISDVISHFMLAPPRTPLQARTRVDAILQHDDHIVTDRAPHGRVGHLSWTYYTTTDVAIQSAPSHSVNPKNDRRAKTMGKPGCTVS